jgi:hypothetical protein
LSAEAHEALGGGVLAVNEVAMPMLMVTLICWPLWVKSVVSTSRAGARRG